MIYASFHLLNYYIFCYFINKSVLFGAQKIKEKILTFKLDR